MQEFESKENVRIDFHSQEKVQGFERERIGLMLGWFLFQPSKQEISKVLHSGKDHKIVELKNKELLYCINGIPELSLQEAELLSNAFEEFKSLNNVEDSINVEFFFKDFCEKNFLELDKEQENYLSEILRLLAYGFGPLSKLLDNENLEEISITGLGFEKPVRVFDRKFEWLKTNLFYCSENAVKNLVNKMARNLGKRLSMQNPRLNTMLSDGSRLCCSIEPVSQLGPNATIRKFRKKPFSPLELVANNTLSLDALAFLQLAFQTDSSIMIAGNTGSGKTSTLNSLFSFVGKNERVIVIEETPELNLMQEHLVKLNVSDGLQIGMKELIVDSLRMRPDRIIVGEVRNSEEMQAFVDTMLAGQGKGSYCTFHAQSAREAITRMKKLGILEIDLLALDLIIVQRRWSEVLESKRKEKRRITEIVEILDNEGFLQQNVVFEFDYAKDCLRKKNESVRVKEKFLKAAGSLKEESFGKELEKRKQELEKCLKKIVEERESRKGIGEND